MERTESAPERVVQEKKIKRPEISKIISIEGFAVTLLWTNREVRRKDYSTEMDEWAADPQLAPLTNPAEFAKAIVENGTLAWPNAIYEVHDYEEWGCDRFQYVIIDSDVIYEESERIGALESHKQLGIMVKSARLAVKMTQEELASRTGFTKQYISRLENGRSDIQFGSLLQIMEVGLGKYLLPQDLNLSYIKSVLT
ncbi:MAG: helix-turn-helix transcriptional regulator [Bacteroidota bacterium]